MAYFTKNEIPNTKITMAILAMRFSPINFSMSGFSFVNFSHQLSLGSIIGIGVLLTSSCIEFNSCFTSSVILRDGKVFFFSTLGVYSGLGADSSIILTVSAFIGTSFSFADSTIVFWLIGGR